MRFLHLHIPDWPLVRRILAEPALRGKPIVLHESQPRGGKYVVSCSAAARQLGIDEGMTVAEATARRGDGQATRAAAETQLVLLPADSVADREALIQLARVCDRFSPVVAIEDAPLPRGLVLDITGLAHLFGSEQQLARQLAAAFGDRGYPARLAIADTPAAARAVAIHAAGSESVLVVPPAGTEHALQPLPVAVLQLPQTTVDVLGQLGVDTMGQLLQLPRDGLESRFGSALLHRLDQALGRAHQLLTPLHHLPSLSAEWNLEIATDHPDSITAILAALLQRIEIELDTQGNGATALTCQLDYEHAPPTRLKVGLYRPSPDASYLLELLQLERERQPLTGLVTNVSITVTATARLTDQQLQLFDRDHPPRDPPALAALIDRLASRLGRRAVLRPRLSAETEPEMAISFRPLVAGPASPRTTRRTTTRRPTFAPLERPTLLLPQPLAIDVTTGPAGQPTHFACQGQQHAVARHWGPERIETGWWRKRTRGIRRDYYRLETTTGARYWLFQDLKQRTWFWHGEF